MRVYKEVRDEHREEHAAEEHKKLANREPWGAAAVSDGDRRRALGAGRLERRVLRRAATRRRAARLLLEDLRQHVNSGHIAVQT